MVAILKHRRVGTAALAAINVAAAELIENTDDGTFRVGDDATLGGHPLGGQRLNSIIATSYTIAGSDQGKLIRFSNASPIAVTIPAASAPGGATNFIDGAFFEFVNVGAGMLTFTPASGQINGVASVSAFSGSSGKIVSDGVNYWAKIAPPPGGTATKTSNYTVLVSDNEKRFDNAGASGTVVLTLPTWANGLRYRFVVMTAQILRVLAPASTQIADGTTNGVAAGNIESNLPYSALCLVATSVANQWAVESATGEWTVT